MTFSMDLNASPLPDDDEHQPYDEQVEVDYAQVEPVESAVAIMRREREERRKRLKREQQDDGSRLHSQQIRNDYVPQPKRHSRIKEAPQGWLDCPAFGEPIDKIIPSKVPLDETFNESVPPGKRYSSKQLVNKQRKAGREICLVIDLTNTTRYYSPAEWTSQGTKHVKIPCKGRDAVPDNESVNVFVYEAMMFLDRPKQSKNPKYMLVHCTHGHNRTGFMIIHYLMRTHISCVAEAINIFAQRRPPGIYKRDYIEALYSFYHEVPENMMIACPPTPEWKRPDDLDLNGEAKQDDDDDNAYLKPPLNESEDKVITNDDVLGDAVPYDQQKDLRDICYRLLEMPIPFPDSIYKLVTTLLSLCKIRSGRKPDGMCLVVGACAHGFEKNTTSDIIFSSSSVKRAGNSGVQLFWEAFPAGSGPNDRTTYMFTYVDPKFGGPKLEELLEVFWDLMPSYQDVVLENLDIRRVIFGIFPTYRDSPLPAAFDRILQVGDASGIQSPVSFGGFGSLTRHLGRLSSGICEAVEGDFLDAHSLQLLNPYMPNLSASWLFQRAMSVRPHVNVSPTFINELLFANFQSMQKLGDSVLRPFLQDVIQFGPLVKTLGLVMVTRPQILPSIFKQVGLGVILEWSGHFMMLGYYTFLSTFIDPVLRSWVESLPPRDKYQWKRYLEAWRYGAGLDYRQGE